MFKNETTARPLNDSMERKQSFQNRVSREFGKALRLTITRLHDPRHSRVPEETDERRSTARRVLPSGVRC